MLLGRSDYHSVQNIIVIFDYLLYPDTKLIPKLLGYVSLNRLNYFIVKLSLILSPYLLTLNSHRFMNNSICHFDRSHQYQHVKRQLADI